MRIIITLVLLMACSFISVPFIKAQEDQAENSFNTGLDIYSSYIWRGSRLGKSPALQPYLEYAKGGLTIGAWGSFDAADYAETDLYVTYDFPFGLSLGIIDYYMCDLEYFDFSDTSGSHALEFSVGFETGGLAVSANYIINQAGGIESEGDDIYLEAGYSFSNVSLFLGAGNGWHTTDGKFNICNLGIGTEKEIKITDSFSIPVSGKVILNPDTESLYVTVGISL